MKRVPLMDCGDGISRADNGCFGKGPTVKTAAYTIKFPDDAGRIFSNRGASGSVTLTLPTPKAGMWFGVAQSAAQDIVITATNGAKIDNGAANGSKTLASGTLYMTIVVSDGTDWFTLNHSYLDISGGTDGQIVVGQTGSDALYKTMSGDATLSAAGALSLAETLVKYAEVSISSAAITGTSAGQLGHAQGVELVAAPGATKVLELLSAVLIYDYAGAGYSGGGNITVNIGGGGSALTGVVSAANSLGATADKIVQFVPLATAGIALTKNTGLNLVAATAFTNGGSATGVVRVKVAYRIHTHGLA